jgi:hypothetical protein
VFNNYLVDSSGAVTDLGVIGSDYVYPYYDPTATTLSRDFFRYTTTDFFTPASETGSVYLFEYPINYSKTQDIIWSYTPGTRRVRLSPEFKYDTPIAAYGGAVDWDEISMFKGRMDKFDFQLVGKKEMIVPYNDYKMAQTTESSLLSQHFLNPDGVRWERHRVWIVSATLKPGERHAFSHWTFYIDEDSWQILASESYDHAGNIYRVGFSYPYQTYAGNPAIDTSNTYGIYDMSKGNYQIAYVNTSGKNFLYNRNELPNMDEYTPQALAANAVH